MENKKVILVDREYNMKTFLAALMEANGYQPLILEDPDQCLCVSRESPPDCIVINVMSLADEGISLYLDIKCEQCLGRVPVILLSPISKKTFEQYPQYKKARREKRIPEPEAFLEVPSQTDEIINVMKGLVAQ